MTRPAPIAALAAVLLVGCAESQERLVPDLLVPDEVAVEWDAQFDEAEGVGALLPVDLMVYDAATGEPMGNMDLTVEPLEDTDDLILLADHEVVNVEPGCLDCYWDAGRDRYVGFEDPGDLLLEVQTDAEGLARVYLWLEALPEPLEIEVAAPQLDPAPRQIFELRSAE